MSHFKSSMGSSLAVLLNLFDTLTGISLVANWKAQVSDWYQERIAKLLSVLDAVAPANTLEDGPWCREVTSVMENDVRKNGILHVFVHKVAAFLLGFHRLM